MHNTWTEISVVTSQEVADAVSNTLIELGSQGTVFEDFPGDPNACCVKAYYPQLFNEEGLINHIREYLGELEQLGINIGKGQIGWKSLDTTDWSSNWKQYFKPVRAGKHLIIKPSWEPFDKEPSDIVIEIDPGMAFGTGLHASTQLSLTFLERYVKNDSAVLDVGTGSGILSIAAARLGARYVLGVDIDAQAVAIARENVRANACDTQREHPIHNRIELSVGSINTLPISRQFNCIVMNIRPDVIRALISHAKPLLEQEGIIILSGILEEEGSQLVHDLSPHDLFVREQRVEEGWIGYVMHKKVS